MARYVRIVFCNVPHYYTQRGNHREPVFHSDTDRLVFLDLLGQNCRQYSVQLLGYALMSNHTHTIAVPTYESSLADALGDTHGRYAQYWNVRYRTTGHLWQGRLFSAALDTGYFLDTLRYVELNPVRARMVEHAEDWPWSSAQAHCSGHDPTGLLDLALWSEHYTPERWREALRLGRSEEALQERIRRATIRGRPLAEPAALAQWEQDLGCTLLPRPPGRPPKKPSATTDLISSTARAMGIG